MTEEATKLVEENHNLIYSYLHKMRLDIDEYYDLAAIGLCKAANAFEISKGYKFSTFAYRCMNNEVVMQMRKENRRIVPLLILDGEDDSIYPFLASDICIEDEILSTTRFQTVIKNMPPKKQRIIFLIASGMTQQEIANKLHVSQSCISKVLAGLKTSLKA